MTNDKHGLLRAVTLCEFTVESPFAYAGTVKLSHDEPILLNEITSGLLPVCDLVEPLVLIDMPFDNLPLRIKDFLDVRALFGHTRVPFTIQTLPNLPLPPRNAIEANQTRDIAGNTSSEIISPHSRLLNLLLLLVVFHFAVAVDIVQGGADRRKGEKKKVENWNQKRQSETYVKWNS